MKARTDIINGIISENGYKTYLEIGLGDESNFKGIKSETKVGIDPSIKKQKGSDNNSYNTFKIKSDDFFEKTNDKFDIIFIDGDHDSRQVEKDLINAYNSLKRDGVVIMHDVNPPSKEAQEVPRKQTQWTGDVWRVATGFKSAYPDIKAEYIPEQYGLFAIYKTGNKKLKEGFTDYDMEFEEFEKKKNKIYGI